MRWLLSVARVVGEFWSIVVYDGILVICVLLMILILLFKVRQSLGRRISYNLWKPLVRRMVVRHVDADVACKLVRRLRPRNNGIVARKGYTGRVIEAVDLSDLDLGDLEHKCIGGVQPSTRHMVMISMLGESHNIVCSKVVQVSVC